MPLVVALPMHDMIKPKAIPFIDPRKNIGISSGRFQLSLGPSRATARTDMIAIDIAVWNSAASVFPKSMFNGRMGAALIFLSVPFSLSKTIAPVETTMLENRSG
jgi:hypothetical protein